MSTGSYSVIRSIPDPIKGEVFNIGVVVWDNEQFRIEIDEKAARHAVNQSPFLARDAWAYFDEFLRDLLVRDGRFDQDALERLIEKPRSETLHLSKPAYVRFPAEAGGFDERVEELLRRLVMRKTGGGSSASPVEDVKERLAPLIRSKAIQQNHRFPATRSTIPRMCHFFVNSGANVALDALRLDLSEAKNAYDRVDIEATKVADVISAGSAIRFFVYCQTGDNEQSRSVVERADKVLSSVGAEVLFSADEAAQALKRVAESRDVENQPNLWLPPPPSIAGTSDRRLSTVDQQDMPALDAEQSEAES
jgi:hypothetical protein